MVAGLQRPATVGPPLYHENPEMAATDGMPNTVAESGDFEPGSTGLPTRLRLLCIGSVEPSWVSLTLQLDALGCVEPSFRWVSTANDALALLRDESFDCLLVRTNLDRQGPTEDPLALARGIRAGGCSDPIVVVTLSTDDETWADALKMNVDLLVSAKGWESSALVPAIRRAVERGRMLHEIDRLAAADRRRLVRERDEAEYLLQQQRQILTAFERLHEPARSLAETPRGHPASAAGSRCIGAIQLTPEFDEYYQELLRTYVIMGSGNLVAEIRKLADLLSQAGFAPQEALDLHLARVERLVAGLGNRSTRHVMARADLLALELMIHLGESYRRQLSAIVSGTDAGVPGGAFRNSGGEAQ
jgi:DNA-binding NarL/FixJ family response regulator